MLIKIYICVYKSKILISKNVIFQTVQYSTVLVTVVFQDYISKEVVFVMRAQITQLSNEMLDVLQRKMQLIVEFKERDLITYHFAVRVEKTRASTIKATPVAGALNKPASSVPPPVVIAFAIRTHRRLWREIKKRQMNLQRNKNAL